MAELRPTLRKDRKRGGRPRSQASDVSHARQPTLLSPFLVGVAVAVAVLAFVISVNYLVFVGLVLIPWLASSRMARTPHMDSRRARTAAAAIGAVYAGVSFPVSEIRFFFLGAEQSAAKLAGGWVPPDNFITLTAAIIEGLLTVAVSILIATSVGWLAYFVTIRTANIQRRGED